jgi:type IV secretory pathway TrbF-like protein
VEKKASIGRVVLYCRHGSLNGTHLPEPSPAIITKVLNEETQESQLFVINPDGLYFNATEYSEELKPGYWSWPKNG